MEHTGHKKHYHNTVYLATLINLKWNISADKNVLIDVLIYVCKNKCSLKFILAFSGMYFSFFLLDYFPHFPVKFCNERKWEEIADDIKLEEKRDLGKKGLSDMKKKS